MDKSLLATVSYQDLSQVVPENLPQYVDEKYIAVPKPPLMWGGQKHVRLVLLIGVQEADRKIFSHVFDFLVDILSDSSNVRRLAQAEDFPGFLDTLDKIARNSSPDN